MTAAPWLACRLKGFPTHQKGAVKMSAQEKCDAFLQRTVLVHGYGWATPFLKVNDGGLWMGMMVL